MYRIIIFLLVLLLPFLVTPAKVLAFDCPSKQTHSIPGNKNSSCVPKSGTTGDPGTVAPVPGGFSVTGGTNLKDEYGFGNIPTLGKGLSLLIPSLFAVATLGVLFYILFAGFKFLTSGGNKESIAAARGMITHAVIAFLMLIMLFLVLRFIPEMFGLDLQIITPFVPAAPAGP